MGGIDLVTTPAVGSAIGLLAIFPVVLALVARVDALRGRNAIQFLVACAMSTAVMLLWLILRPEPRLANTVLAGMLFATGLMLHLEVWALLSRGYTLGLVAAIRRASGPVSADQLAATYRGGDGITWIMRHRLGGLERARLVRRDGDSVRLTWLGVLVGYSHRALVRVLGLRRTG
jgi:hypothetical protein